MVEQFIKFVIRPPRAEYNPDQYLLDSEFNLAGRKFKRQDLNLTNGRGHVLQCSHYVPFNIQDSTPLPCVIYCHGNSGCRADANEAAIILLPSNITVFTLDFSGSGLSDGDYVSLGWHEKDDLKTVVSFLRSSKNTSRIGLWGRSMGAVTSLLYGAKDPSISGMVLDSAFSNLHNLMMELANVYKTRLPKFTVKMGLHYMRRVIQRRAKFDIMELDTIEFSPKTFIPALFGHASEDVFIPIHHTDRIYKSYAGDKNMITFAGNHNSPRPQFYYNFVSIFFHSVLHPPHVSSTLSTNLEKYYDLGELKILAGIDKSLCEMGSSLQTSRFDASSSSSSSVILNGPTSDSVIDLLAVCSKDNKSSELSEGYLSHSSSNRENWGRCSSLGVSEEEEAVSTKHSTSNQHQVQTAIQHPSSSTKKTKRERLSLLSRQLRHCILRRVSYKQLLL